MRNARPDRYRACRSLRRDSRRRARSSLSSVRLRKPPQRAKKSSTPRSMKPLRRLSPSRAAAQVAEQLNIPRKRAYARALERRNEPPARPEKRGRGAETLACWYLRLKGWRILARRARVPGGEVDVVARRGHTLAFIEVKARASEEAAAFSLDDWRLATGRTGRGAPRPALHARRTTTSGSTPCSSSPAAGRGTSPTCGKVTGATAVTRAAGP